MTFHRSLAALLFSCLLASTLLLGGCARSGEPTPSAPSTPSTPQDESVATTLSESIDYTQAQNWLAKPTSLDKPVDVLYLYPTVWAKTDPSEPNICNIDNASMRAGAPVAFEAQATSFEKAGNVFAPYYRQADAAYALTISDEEQNALMDGIPKQDAFAALDYYFEHDNNGRPFILAGHSQGSNVLLFVLSEYMQDHPDYYERMVAAYVVGYSVTEDYLEQNPHLKFAQSASDTGVIISYNTEAPVVDGPNPVVLPHSVAINPITWTRTAEVAPAEKSLGSRINGGDAGSLADATLDLERGTVLCSTVDRDQFSANNGLFPKGVYHGQDYPFYYYDLEANAILRTDSFLAAL